MFEYSGNCFVRHFDGGRAVSDDANPKAKIKINIPDMEPKDVAGILLCTEEDALVFFDSLEKNGEHVIFPRFKGITKIKAGNTWENAHTVKIGQLKKQTCAQLKITEVKPADGGVFDVTLFALVERPQGLEILAERCNRIIPLLIVQTGDDPPVQVDIEDELPKDQKGAASPEKQTDAFTKKGKVSKRASEKAQS